MSAKCKSALDKKQCRYTDIDKHRLFYFIFKASRSRHLPGCGHMFTVIFYISVCVIPGCINLQNWSEKQVVFLYDHIRPMLMVWSDTLMLQMRRLSHNSGNCVVKLQGGEVVHLVFILTCGHDCKVCVMKSRQHLLVCI